MMDLMINIRGQRYSAHTTWRGRTQNVMEFMLINNHLSATYAIYEEGIGALFIILVFAA